MKKNFSYLASVALLSGLLLAGSGASAQSRALKSEQPSAGTLLRIPDGPITPDEPGQPDLGPTGPTGTTGGGWWNSSRFVVFPNPVVGRIINFAAPTSGRLVIQLYALSGPQSGQGFILDYQANYPANTPRQVVLQSYFYPGPWMLVGKIGNVVYNERVNIDQ